MGVYEDTVCVQPPQQPSHQQPGLALYEDTDFLPRQPLSMSTATNVAPARELGHMRFLVFISV